LLNLHNAMLRAILVCAIISILCVGAGALTGGVMAATALRRTDSSSYQIFVIGTGMYIGAFIGGVLSVVTWLDNRRRDLPRLIVIAWGSSIPVLLVSNGLMFVLPPLCSLLAYLDMRRLPESTATNQFIRRAFLITMILGAAGVLFSIVTHR
jgi:hypothetical protein